MNYYQRHIGDYLRDTSHLSLLEHGVYTRLLDVYYTREACFPADSAAIARLVGARAKDEISALKTVLGEFFTATDSGFTHKRCDAEIAKYQERAATNREVGKRGGRPKKTQSVISDNRDGLRKTDDVGSEKNPNQEPVTNNQEPINSVTNVTGGKPPAADSIFAYGVPMLTVAGIAEKQARSFLGMARKTHGDDAVLDALRQCYRAKPLQPLEWLAKVLPPSGGKPSTKSVLDAAKAEIFGHAEQ